MNNKESLHASRFYLACFRHVLSGYMKAREAHEMSLLAGHEGNVAQEIRLSDMIGRDNSVFEL